jgi:sialate O-acetylesterase
MLGLHAQLKLASLVGDNMVLQQQTDARLWGWAKAGDKITATTSWNGKTVQTTANKEGLWILSVSTPQASFTPYEITITVGKTPVTLTNILLGEVWLAGGQSNMEMPLKGFGG